jgi:hypothetical protein
MFHPCYLDQPHLTNVLGRLVAKLGLVTMVFML